MDYWLNKLCFDVQNSPEVRVAFRNDRDAVLADYPLSADIREAIQRDDVTYLSRFTNPYLLRYFFFHSGMPENTFIDEIRSAEPTNTEEAQHG